MTKLRDGITVAIPAHNEASTIGSVVERLRSYLESTSEWVAEILVVDDRSTDDTAAVAISAGASVVRTNDVCSTSSGSAGKGDAIWAAVHQCDTNLIGFIDADLDELDPEKYMELFRHLRDNPDVQLTKGTLTRVRDGQPSGPGRVTALTAKPLLSLLRPDMSSLRDPLSGLFATRTESIGALWLDCDYGVDVGVVLDIADRYGPEAVVEIEIGRIAHRRRPLDQLSLTAEQVARAIIARSYESRIPSDDLLRRRPPALAARRRANFLHLRHRQRLQAI
ncbi:MAG: glycosyltransferase [Ilumatobacteraceae bacterium]|jgi:glucosyl-3-phosphoglycerate synthase